MKVLMYTKVYNGEKTLARAIESVLSQSHTTLDYYVFDNGSTDGTRAIILSYMAKDPRVKLLVNEANNLYALADFQRMLAEVDRGQYDYLAVLDADDAYGPDFLKEAMDYMVTHQVGVCAVASRFVAASSGAVLHHRQLSGNLCVKEKDQWDQQLEYYYQFVRTTWGKLYAMDVIQKMNYDKGITQKIINGGDTYFVLEALKVAEGFGILQGVHHTYYYTGTGAQSTYHINRVRGYHLIHQTAKALLQKKAGRLSQRNEMILRGIFINDLYVLLDVLLRQPKHIQLGEMAELLSLPLVQRILQEMCEYPQDEAVRQQVLKQIEGVILSTAS